MAATADHNANALLHVGRPDGTLCFLSASISDVGNLTSGWKLNLGQDGTDFSPHKFQLVIADLAIWRSALSVDEIIQDDGEELASLVPEPTIPILIRWCVLFLYPRKQRRDRSSTH